MDHPTGVPRDSWRNSLGAQERLAVKNTGLLVAVAAHRSELEELGRTGQWKARENKGQ